jgi:hypothetical protein
MSYVMLHASKTVGALHKIRRTPLIIGGIWYFTETISQNIFLYPILGVTSWLTKNNNK